MEILWDPRVVHGLMMTYVPPVVLAPGRICMLCLFVFQLTAPLICDPRSLDGIGVPDSSRIEVRVLVRVWTSVTQVSVVNGLAFVEHYSAFSAYRTRQFLFARVFTRLRSAVRNYNAPGASGF